MDNIPSLFPTVVSEKRERPTFMLGPVLHLPASVFKIIITFRLAGRHNIT